MNKEPFCLTIKERRDNQLKWDLRFLRLAEHIASWSRDPSTKVGAVIVDKRRFVVGVGYNGFPKGVLDLQERYDDRPTKYSMVVHAEANAILSSNRKVNNCTVYTYPLFTCNECAKLVIQSGIKRVVAPKVPSERWQSSYDISMKMYEEAGVVFDIIDMENGNGN